MAKLRHGHCGTRSASRRAHPLKQDAFVLFCIPDGSIPSHEAEVLKILLNAEPLDVEKNYEPAKGTPTALTPLGRLCLPLEGLVDFDAEKERLGKEIVESGSRARDCAQETGERKFRRQCAAGRSRGTSAKRKADFAEQLAQFKADAGRIELKTTRPSLTSAPRFSKYSFNSGV